MKINLKTKKNISILFNFKLSLNYLYSNKNETL